MVKKLAGAFTPPAESQSQKNESEECECEAARFGDCGDDRNALRGD